MKIKTSELIGSALDWVVANCCGDIPYIVKKKYSTGYIVYPFRAATIPLEYSTTWAQGGPIIEREKIGLQEMNEKAFQAWKGTHIEAPCWPKDAAYAEGPTPLIAAMRCYVASKLGDEVDVPKELI